LRAEHIMATTVTWVSQCCKTGRGQGPAILQDSADPLGNLGRYDLRKPIQRRLRAVLGRLCAAARYLVLEQASAVGHRLRGRDKHHLALLVGETQGQHLGHELADLPRREIDDRSHLAPHQALGRVVLGDLRAGFLDAKLGTEVDAQLERGLTRLGKSLYTDDGSDAHVHRCKMSEIDQRDTQFSTFVPTQQSCSGHPFMASSAACARLALLNDLPRREA
jgi:hypothetical protein